MPGGIVQGIAALQAAEKQVEASKKALRVVEGIFQQSRADVEPQIQLGQESTNFLRGLFFGTGPTASLFGKGAATREVLNPEVLRLQEELRGTDPIIQGISRQNREGDARQATVPNPRFNELQSLIASTPQFVSEPIPGAIEGREGADIGNFVRRFDPTFDFRLSEGLKALDRSAASRGLLRSGAQNRAVTEFGTNIASLGSENFLNRLQNFAGLGTNTALATGQTQAQGAGLQSGIIQDAGTARASGIIGAGRGFGSALNNIAQFGAFQGAAACWVAREVFGFDNPKWLQFRRWMIWRAPMGLFQFYGVHGRDMAAWLSKHTWAKSLLRPLMNLVIRYGRTD